MLKTESAEGCDKLRWICYAGPCVWRTEPLDLDLSWILSHRSCGIPNLLVAIGWLYCPSRNLIERTIVCCKVHAGSEHFEDAAAEFGGGCPSIMLTRPAVCMRSHSCCVVSPKSVLFLSMLSRLDNRAHSPVPGHRSIKRHVHGFRPPTEGKTENRKLFPTLSSDPNCERCADVCFRAETPQASECAAA